MIIPDIKSIADFKKGMRHISRYNIMHRKIINKNRAGIRMLNQMRPNLLKMYRLGLFDWELDPKIPEQDID